ncbi:MAG: tRNA (5-methylaminomethyl-2-thiouridine)(34)-methyltransferase MnmD [Amphritea sp.]|nr:tRNA (5-methylaminomethyl-2-thiouridine)(34)-methyltransferase MnmD [Amphritea sp.]
MKSTTLARLNWNIPTPYSDLYDDFYFSTDDGLAETEFVFLERNQLTSRFNTHMRSVFTIAETGFGTGLNFLATWRSWRNSTTKNSLLHFISTERYPLTVADPTKALNLWPEFSEFSSQLIEQYPVLTSGFHRINFNDDRITLTRMFADTTECYRQLNANVDAWFLDGFSPSKNPDIWTSELFSQICPLSSPGTTFATFTCARIVKKRTPMHGF